jgi:hypothetical protein
MSANDDSTDSDNDVSTMEEDTNLSPRISNVGPPVRPRVRLFLVFTWSLLPFRLTLGSFCLILFLINLKKANRVRTSFFSSLPKDCLRTLASVCLLSPLFRANKIVGPITYRESRRGVRSA